ncbi:hypothetical protein BH23BAC2_BH23BAC2_21970 [soil metagenome]
MMNKSFFLWLVVLMVIGFNSCDTDEVHPEVLPDAIDTYKYIALRSDGQLFEVGNHTGKISPVNKIPGIEFVSNLNTLTFSPTNLYIYEHKFPPLQSTIHVYNRTTKTTQTKTISFPKEVFGEAPGLVSLEWDETNGVLVGLVKEHYESGPNHITRVARIDPVNFEVTSMNIELDRAHVISTQLIENKIYTSTYKPGTGGGSNDFFQIDLATGTLTSLELPNMVWPPIHLSKNNTNNLLFGFLPVAGSTFAGEGKPVTINPATRQVTNLFPNEMIGNKNFSGRSFFNPGSGEHVDFITSATYNGLFQYNTNTQEVAVTELPLPNDLSSMVAIVDVRKVN